MKIKILLLFGLLSVENLISSFYMFKLYNGYYNDPVQITDARDRKILKKEYKKRLYKQRLGIQQETIIIDGITVLHLARTPQEVSFWLKQGAQKDLETTDLCNGFTPRAWKDILYKYKAANRATIRKLIEKGAEGGPLLFDLDYDEKLLKKEYLKRLYKQRLGIQQERIISDGITVLHLARTPQEVSFWLKQGAQEDLETKDLCRNLTPLRWKKDTCEYSASNRAVVRKLIRKGAKGEPLPFDLHNSKDLKILAALYSKKLFKQKLGIQQDTTLIDGITVLHLVKTPEEVTFWIHHGAQKDLETKDLFYGYTPLHHAFLNKRDLSKNPTTNYLTWMKIMQTLLYYGANPSPTRYLSSSNHTTLQSLAKDAHYDAIKNTSIVRLLLLHGADPSEFKDRFWGDTNISDSYFEHCLHSSFKHPKNPEWEKMLHLLLTAPNNPVNPAEMLPGNKVAMELALHYKPSLIPLLAQYPGVFELQNADGDTPIHSLVRKYAQESVKIALPLLLANGAKINARNKDGNTPLHLLAARHASEETTIYGDLVSFEQEDPHLVRWFLTQKELGTCSKV